MKKETINEALRFVLVGGVATVLHYLIYIGLMHVIPATVAYALGYGISFIYNFFATAYFTFHTRPDWTKLAGMGVAHGINFLLHMVLFSLFVCFVPKAWVPIPVYAIAIPINFLLVRFVFKR